MHAHFVSSTFQFTFFAQTSRNAFKTKKSYFLIIEDENIHGIGECSPIPLLSIDPIDSYEQKLTELCDSINKHGNVHSVDLNHYPSIAFGLEIAMNDFLAGGNRMLYHSKFTKGDKGIHINGLIWMGDKSFMLSQIKDKIDKGFRCLKIKIGALDFSTELDIISSIRKRFNCRELELRLDANGAFEVHQALEKLKILSDFGVHSIEQPIKQGQWEQMYDLCHHSPIPIALDEELIGQKPNGNILQSIQPQYIILKPSLIGGIAIAQKWIELAEDMNIGWWATSALESNIGLNGIAQWIATSNNQLPQGLGTGQLYANNITSPLELRKDELFYNPNVSWDLQSFIA